MPLIALQAPSMSVWSVLFGSGSDQALITLTGFDHRVFQYLLTSFGDLYNETTPYSKNCCIARKRGTGVGRDQSMSARDCLGLALSWYRARGAPATLCMLYGITASLCKMFIRFSHRILMRVLSCNPLARVKMPTTQEIRTYQATIRENYSMQHDVYVVGDGLKLQLEQSGEAVVQDIFYNVWAHDDYVGYVFVFAPSKVIIACSVNAPGSMHYSCKAEWGSFYDTLEIMYERTGGPVIVDSSFA